MPGKAEFWLCGHCPPSRRYQMSITNCPACLECGLPQDRYSIYLDRRGRQVPAPRTAAPTCPPPPFPYGGYGGPAPGPAFMGFPPPPPLGMPSMPPPMLPPPPIPMPRGGGGGQTYGGRQKINWKCCECKYYPNSIERNAHCVGPHCNGHRKCGGCTEH